ncbi:hypothetical protein PV327_006971 [Microctonus hyperodae]|uniref:Amino acid transporter transmembrane domain-containing protein n=1 Tax=Microctonus hyperodae TaxID=165561 RepID=A0AA39KJ54_MICHY|nr:hypothetical protein PV327_006971 [Microctonus hyperodae]
MISYISHVMTLANSIIGVSVLAMPFCFKQCGIILSAIVLILCSLLSRIACHFLIKSAVMSRRRNYELLAFHAFGPMGKVMVELLIIGFLIGTCIAFFVVIGDLGPQIIGKLLNKNPEDIKLSFLLTTATLIILPLGLLKNIESLASICTVAIGFYLCLVLKVIMESMGQIFTGDWYNNVNYWRPAGILQCLPIFSMALFCQTQLFEIYESIPNVSLEKMNVVVRGALNICTLVYISVGFFGYVAFCTQSFSGNILMSFDPSMTSDVMKIGFVLSVIGSFPLVIFPCRASLNSLLFRRMYMHEAFTNYIPEIRFRCLTFTIITVSLITGLLMPNIEFVLGLVGSTIGVMICLLIPAAFFITISTKNTNERLFAQAMLFIGVWIMILGTYANVYSIEESSTARISVFTEKPILQINNIQLNSNIDNKDVISKALDLSINEKGKLVPSPQVVLDNIVEAKNFIDTGGIETHVQKVTNNNSSILNNKEITNIIEKPKIYDETKKIQIDNSIKSEKKIFLESLSAEEKIKAIEEKEKHLEQQGNENLISSDAIKKEETEIAEAAADQIANAEEAERLKEKQRVKDTLEQNKIETMELLKEQKVIVQNMKEQKKEFEKDKKILKDLLSNKIEENILQPKVGTIDDKNNMKINNEVKNNVKAEKSVASSLLDEKKKNMPIGSSNDQSNIKKNQRLPRVVETKELIQGKNNLDQDLIVSSSNHNQISIKDNISLEYRGPILNALTNKTVQHTNVDLSSTIIEDTPLKGTQNDSNPSQYAVPIALKLLNPTNDSIVQPVLDPVDTVNKSPINHRDILEDHVREKRDVNNNIIEKNITKNISKIEIEPENLECAKNKSLIKVEEDSNDIKKIIDTESTTPILIKTNAYLSDEKIIDNIINVNPNSLMNIGEYQIVKKRDLKSLELNKSPN